MQEMESSNASPTDESNNVDTAMQDLVVEKYDDCNSEVLTTQGEDDQTGEQIYFDGYLEEDPGSENATIYLNSQELHYLNGHRVLLAQSGEGNEVFVVVGDDLNGQPLGQNFTSVLHTEESFRNEMKELVVDETSQNFELVETGEVPEEQEKHVYIENTDDLPNEQERHVYIENTEDADQERHVYIENSEDASEDQERHVYIENSEEIPQEQERHVYIENTGEMIRIKRESMEAPQEQKRHVYIENTDEMVEIERESLDMTPEQEKHMYIDNDEEDENMSRNQSFINSGVESIEFGSSDSQQKSTGTKMFLAPNPTVVSSSALMQKIKNHHKLLHLAKACEGQPKSDVSNADANTKVANYPLNEVETSVIVAQDPPKKDSSYRLESPDSESTRTPDNAVSVIHVTSELQNNLENKAKPDISYESSSPENYSALKNKDDLPADVLSSSASRDSLQQPDSKPLEDSSNKHLEDDENSIPSEIDQSNIITDPLLNAKLDSLSGENSGGFEEQSPKLDDTSVIENNYMDDDDNSHAGSCLLVVEEDESKDGDNTSEDKSEKDAEIATSYQKKQLKTIKVPTESDSKSICNSDTVDTSKLSVSVKNESSPMSNKYSVFSYKSKAKTLFSTGSSLPVSAVNPVCGHVGISEAMSQYEFSESEEVHFKDADCRRENNLKSKLLNSQSDSLGENTDADLANTESFKDSERIPSATITNSLPSPSSQNLKILKVVEVESASVVTDSQFSPPTKEFAEKDISENLAVDDSTKFSSKDCLRENTIDDCLSPTCSISKEIEDNEETLVKPPKKTYIREKNRTPSKMSDGLKNGIELFSLDQVNFSECDKEIEEAKKSLNEDQCEHVLNKTTINSEEGSSYVLSAGPSHENKSIEAASPPENGTNTDDFFSMHNVKVSATYNIKKKPKPEILSSKKEIKSRRTRSSASKKPLENGTLGDFNCETHKNSFDSSSSENIPWGDVLLRTSFQPSASKDAPSTSQAAACDVPCTSQTALRDVSSTSQTTSNGIQSTSPIYSTSTPISEQQRRRTNKLKRDFDRLLHSPKSKAASNKKVSSSKKLISDIKKKKDKFKLSSPSSKSDAVNEGSSNREYSESISALRVKRPRYQGSNKVASIKYLKGDARKSLAAPPEKGNDSDFYCSSCNFSTGLVNNLIEHLKYCEKRQPLIDYTVEDMEKRQRIRGEDIDTCQKISNIFELRNYVTESLNNIRNLDVYEGECSQNHVDSNEEIDFDVSDKKSKYGYGVDDVVWAKVEDRFWPGLVCELEERKAYIKLINYPNEIAGLKISAERVHTFDDAKWNKMLLAEAENLPNSEVFVRAVQTSETFVRKKWLGFNVKAKDFFSVPDKVDFVTDNESSDSNINEDSDFDITDLDTIPQHRRARYEKLDIQKIKDYIAEGNTDDYVVDIYNGEQSSKKHQQYNSNLRNALLHKTWFGPCETICEGAMVRHFQTLFLKVFGKEHFSLSYILQVWIPEAIVKAISDVEGIPLEEAGNLFESEDSTDTEGPSIEEIEQMYS